jgi:hypothetical protein
MECRKRVRGYEGIPGHDEPHKFIHLWMVGKSAWGSTQIAWIHEAWHLCVWQRAVQNRVCISYNEMMSIHPWVSEIYNACRWVHLLFSCIFVYIYIGRFR